MSEEKPAVLILGGTGFVGRHLVKLLVDTQACSLIRAADKLLPAMAWLTPEEEAMYKNTPGLEYKMSNLVNAQSVAKTFEISEGKQFDIVINLASTAEYGQDKETYQMRVVELVKICGEEAKKRGIKKWIEVSTSQVYKPEDKAATEKSKIKPWTMLAEAKLAAEEVVKSLGIPYIIVRPAIIYGPGDIGGIMPRLVCGTVYKRLNVEMNFLWKGTLQINTVHVKDAASAIWFLANKGQVGEIYNLADSGKTNQQIVADCIHEIFGIKTGFYKSIVSNMARLMFKSAVAQSNEEHMQPWGDILRENNIERSPLSPYLEPEILYDNNTAIDGTKITKLGFEYQVPKLTKELLVDSINYWISIKAFPPI